MTPHVEISGSGRGGSISYHEGPNTARFDWEFALSPALALIFGPKEDVWDRRFPWAAGRQGEIYDVVAREVVRQKASGCGFELDLAGGVITVLQPPGTRRRATLDAVSELPDAQRKELIHALTREGLTGPVVEALGSIGDPEAQATVDAAVREHLSIENRLAAAEVMHEQGRSPLRGCRSDAPEARPSHQSFRPQGGLRCALPMHRDDARGAILTRTSA